MTGFNDDETKISNITPQTFNLDSIKIEKRFLQSEELVFFTTEGELPNFITYQQLINLVKGSLQGIAQNIDHLEPDTIKECLLKCADLLSKVRV